MMTNETGLIVMQQSASVVNKCHNVQIPECETNLIIYSRVYYTPLPQERFKIHRPTPLILI